MPRKVERYVDNRGIEFGEIGFHLRGRPGDWPRITRVTRKGACTFMHEFHQACWQCGKRGYGLDATQAHHIFEGSRGKSEELCNIAMLCALHHGQLSDPIIPLGRILYLKWKHDWLHTDWVRMTLLCGYHLPDLIADED